VTIRQNDKRVLGIFSLRMHTNAMWELLGPDKQRIVSATYELLRISGTYDKLTTTAEVSLENLTL